MEKKKDSMISSVKKLAAKCAAIDYSKPARSGLLAKGKFMAVRMMQTGLGKENPEYRDFNYWKDNGWLGSARPWK